MCFTQSRGAELSEALQTYRPAGPRSREHFGPRMFDDDPKGNTGR